MSKNIHNTGTRFSEETGGTFRLTGAQQDLVAGWDVKML
jgi:hypothetical protein